jgi:phage tail-like protein
MTQARRRFIEPPSITSSQLPETLDWMEEALQVEIRTNPRRLIPGHPDNSGLATSALLLIPGQVGEITVQLQNPKSTPLSWTIEIDGDFPASWLIEQSLTSEIAPQELGVVNLQFCIPSHFFEEQVALNSHQRTLQVNYESQISVYINPPASTEPAAEQPRQRGKLVGYQTFYLAVRSPSSYLNYLPEIYGESDFMGRFLMIFEQAFDPAVQTLDTLWAYLDPLTAPKDMLPFLAHWVAWKMEPRWDLKQQRRLIRHAVELYRWRGTKQGLRLFLHLYTDLSLDEDLPEAEKHISITEDFNRKFTLGEVSLGQAPMLGGGSPYHFTVTLRPDSVHSLDRALIIDIIDQYKPAFCTYDLHILNAA